MSHNDKSTTISSSSPVHTRAHTHTHTYIHTYIDRHTHRPGIEPRTPVVHMERRPTMGAARAAADQVSAVKFGGSPEGGSGRMRKRRREKLSLTRAGGWQRLWRRRLRCLRLVRGAAEEEAVPGSLRSGSARGPMKPLGLSPGAVRRRRRRLGRRRQRQKRRRQERDRRAAARGTWRGGEAAPDARSPHSHLMVAEEKKSLELYSAN